MFQDPRPVSTFRDTVGSNAPPSQSTLGLKAPPFGSRSSSSLSVSPGRPARSPRPPFSQSSSASSSLGGLEQAVPSFQSFVKRTPSVDSNPNKPLPPTPIATKRSEGSPKDSLYRRQSSVYSSNLSDGSSGQQSPWKLDLPTAESSLLLQHIAYSASSPDLVTPEERENPLVQILAPRAFAPLVDTPSTLSTVIVDPPPTSSPRTNTPGVTIHAVNQKPQTVSLEQAKQAINAPGAVHLLPEELRELKKLKSHGRLRSTDIFALGQKAPLPSPTSAWRDSQGRERMLSSAVKSDLKSPAQNAFPVGTGPVREMKLYTLPQAGEGLDNEEPRGRTMQRLSSQAGRLHDKSESDRLGQAAFAREYKSLLGEQTRAPSSSPGYTSDDSIKTHMKMVPHPLFQGKHRLPSNTSRGSPASKHSVSPFSISRGRRSGSSRSSGTGFNLRLSSVNSSEIQDTASGKSKTGVIPISPPHEHEPKRNKPPPVDTTLTQGTSRPKAHKREKSLSHFYPHTMHRKSPKQAKNKTVKPEIVGKPLLAADVIAQELKTPESTSEASPLTDANLASSTSIRKPSETGSERFKRRFYQRITQGVKNRRRSSQKDIATERDLSPGTTPAAKLASPNSPHLLPTTAIYLGWSDASKRNFDEAKSPTISHSRLHPPPQPTEIEDEDDEPENSSIVRLPNFVGHVLGGGGGNVFEGWKEMKAQRKREDLKKMIKVVTPSVAEETETRPDLGRRSGSGFLNGTLPVVLPRRMSTYGRL